MIQPQQDSTSSRIRNALGPLALGVLVLGLSALAARAIRGRVDHQPRPASSGTLASNPGPASPAGRGRLIYQVQCARCHGPEGHGDGPDSANLQPAPRDFASNTWRSGPGPEAVRKSIVEGIPGTAMYPLGGSLSPRELDAVVEHVRSLAPKPDSITLAPDLEKSLKAVGFAREPLLRKAPAIEVEDLEGKARSLKFGPCDRLTLLVFWGTSCAPCQEELPELERLATDFRSRGLDVIPVCVDESNRAVVRRVIRGKFDRFPSFVSADGMAQLRYDIQTLPAAALIDRGGNLLGIARGAIDWRGEEARRLIAACLASSH